MTSQYRLGVSESPRMTQPPKTPEAKDWKRTVGAVLVFLAIGAGMVLFIIARHEHQSRRITAWAAQNGYTLAGDVQRAYLDTGPFLLNLEEDEVFRVDLEDATHQRRTAWFRFRLMGMEQAWKD